MAFAKGRQAMDETPKAECLRRWPALNLSCAARRYKGRIEGFVITKNGQDIFGTGSRAASEAWSVALSILATADSQPDSQPE